MLLLFLLLPVGRINTTPCATKQRCPSCARLWGRSGPPPPALTATWRRCSPPPCETPSTPQIDRRRPSLRQCSCRCVWSTHTLTSTAAQRIGSALICLVSASCVHLFLLCLHCGCKCKVSRRRRCGLGWLDRCCGRYSHSSHSRVPVEFSCSRMPRSCTARSSTPSRRPSRR